MNESMKVLDSTIPKLKIGSTVRIHVPDVNRGIGDARLVLVVVLEAAEDGSYHLRMKHGI